MEILQIGIAVFLILLAAYAILTPDDFDPYDRSR